MSWQDEQFQKQRETESAEPVAIDTINVAVVDQSERWDPRELPDELLAVEPFCIDLLPKVFQAWITDIAERLQCPADFPAVAIMVVVSGIVGRKIGIRPQQRTDWLVVANLWGAAIGRPGLMKTPAIQEPLNILKRLEIDAKQQYDSAAREHEASLLIANATRKVRENDLRAAVKNNKEAVETIARELMQLDEPEPVRRRYLVNDGTVEKLGEILKENSNGVIVFRDELTGLLKSLDKEGREGARAFYLEAWNGTGRYTFDRIGRGTLDIPAAIVSVVGGIQPGPLSEYLRRAVNGGAGDDGLLQRFQLAVWPDCPRTWRMVDRIPDSKARQAAVATCQRLDGLEAVELAAEHDESESVPFLRFDYAAQERFNLWRSKLEPRLRSGSEHPAIESHLAKYRSLIPSLALLIHLADEPDGGPVTLEALERALAWGRYLESHARRMYGSIAQRSSGAAKSLAAKIEAESLQDGFTLRDVYRPGWSGLTDRSDAQAAVDVLIDHNWLASETIDTGGRPQIVYRINHTSPKLTDKTDRSPLLSVLSVPPEAHSQNHNSNPSGVSERRALSWPARNCTYQKESIAMASISRDPNGRKRILFVAGDGKRKSVRLGKVNQRTAEAIKVKIEALVAASITGHAVDNETSRWLVELDQMMLDKLSKVGLIDRQRVATLGAFIDEYIAGRSDLKARTQELLQVARDNLVSMFSVDMPLRDFSEGDADTYRQSLLNQGLAANTVRRRCGRVKQFFKAAVRRKLIDSNPFADIRCNVTSNKARFVFISREDAEKVIEACPDSQWRTLFALARYGGLRCPSETLNLRWQDIDWHNQRMTVRSPKTEHHEGRESRQVPIFPELLPHLEEAFELADEGDEFVITRYRSQDANLRTQLQKIIRRAGLEVWQKPWQNLRSSRETELVETFPVHVAAAWLGNTEAVANKHYLQVTGDHFRRAIESGAESGAVDAESGAQAAHYPAQQSAATSRVETKKPLTESGVTRSNASECGAVRYSKAPRHGLEP